MAGRIKDIGGPQTRTHNTLGGSVENRYAQDWDALPGMANALRRSEVKRLMGQRMTHRGPKPIRRG